MMIRHRLEYDAAPGAVYEMLSDPAFRDKVCEAMNTVSHDVEIDRAEAGMSVRIDMVQRTQGVPGFAKKIVGDQTRIIQSEDWVAAHGAPLAARLVVEIPGKPAAIRGTITLTGDESGTVESFAGEAKVNIPLVGGKVEGLIEKLFIAGMDAEQRVGSGWLVGQR